jgi:hypothetical protein
MLQQDKYILGNYEIKDAKGHLCKNMGPMNWPSSYKR